MTEVRKKIGGHLSDVRKCYDNGLKKNPNLEGKIVIDWEIGIEGKVAKAELNKERSTLQDPEVEKCIIEISKSWNFTAPPEGTVATIRYPFVFTRMQIGTRK